MRTFLHAYIVFAVGAVSVVATSSCDDNVVGAATERSPGLDVEPTKESDACCRDTTDQPNDDTHGSLAADIPLREPLLRVGLRPSDDALGPVTLAVDYARECGRPECKVVGSISETPALLLPISSGKQSNGTMQQDVFAIMSDRFPLEPFTVECACPALPNYNPVAKTIATAPGCVDLSAGLWFSSVFSPSEFPVQLDCDLDVSLCAVPNADPAVPRMNLAVKVAFSKSQRDSLCPIVSELGWIIDAQELPVVVDESTNGRTFAVSLAGSALAVTSPDAFPQGSWLSEAGSPRFELQSLHIQIPLDEPIASWGSILVSAVPSEDPPVALEEWFFETE